MIKTINVGLLPNSVYTFQFHKGTIKTVLQDERSFFQKLFQFHKGTIKTSAGFGGPAAVCYFNSIKVRLRPHHTCRVGEL